MQPLLDSDILLYEIGFSGQTAEGPRDWSFVEELLNNRIKLICDEVGATQPPLLFLTNTLRINKLLNKQRKREETEAVEYKDNFRIELAKEKEYKGGRKAEKPFHFYNILAYILSAYETRIHEGGIEADDFMCITQYSRLENKDTIICSRDKDLKQCPGWHYSWEVGAQAARGPFWVDHLGDLIHENPGELNAKGKPKPMKVFGTGHKFFYYQLLNGDKVDNIGGVKNRGPVFAYNLLKDAETERQCYELVAEVYVKAWEGQWKEKMKEQADLLHMVREVHPDGSLKLWLPPAREEVLAD